MNDFEKENLQKHLNINEEKLYLKKLKDIKSLKKSSKILVVICCLQFLVIIVVAFLIWRI